jgi:hypothetical protein
VWRSRIRCSTTESPIDENIAQPGYPHLRPQSLRFRRTRAPWEVSRVGPYRADAANQADTGPGAGCGQLTNLAVVGDTGCADFVYLIHNGVPTSTLDLGTSMQGIRFIGKTVAGLDFTINYLFKKTEVPARRFGSTISSIRTSPPTGARILASVWSPRRPRPN